MAEVKIDQVTLEDEDENNEAAMIRRVSSEDARTMDKELVGTPEVQLQKETDKEKAKREKEEKNKKLQEFGGKIGFFTLFSLATPGEKATFALGIIGALGHGFGQISIQFFFGDLIDKLGSKSGDVMDATGEAALKMCAVGVAVWVAASLYGFAFPWFVETQVQKMRPMYFDALLHRDIGWFDTHEAAALSTEMMSDIEAYSEGLGLRFANAISSFAMFVGGFVVAFSKSWKLTLVMIATLPGLFIGFIAGGKAGLDMVKEAQGGYVKASSIIDECLFAIRTVVSFGGEQRELARFAGAVDQARWAGVKIRITVGSGFGYFMGAMIAMNGFALWYGAKLLREGGDLSAGDIVATFGAVLMAGFSFGQGMPGIMENLNARGAMAKFFWLIKNEPTTQRVFKDERRELGGPVQTLELKNVHFAYPARPDCKVLNGVSLSIGMGQKIALVGESGSGKSTVMALLERFYDPSQGQVLVNGQDIKELNIRSVRRSIGYVGQEPVLFATTVEKNIRMGCPDATDADVKSVVQQAQMSFIDALPEKLQTYVGSGGSQFSGGQKQRIAIARALLKKPSHLFLDEATSALDNKSERMIQGTIDEISRKSTSGMTIVAIAHRLSTIQNSDVIFVFRAGIVVESGSHDELLQKGGVYQALAAAQQVTLENQNRNGEEDVSKLPSKQFNSKDAAKMSSENAREASIRQHDDEAEKAREKKILKEYKIPLSRLLVFCKREWPLIPPGCLFAAMSGSAFPIMGSVILSKAIFAIMEEDWDTVNEYTIWFFVFGGVKWIAQTLQFTCFSMVGEGLTMRTRNAMLKLILSQEIGFHDDPEHTPGQLAKALQVYSYRAQRIALSIGDSSDAICTLLCGVSIAFYYSWQLTLFALAFMPFLGATQVLQMKMIIGSAAEENETIKKSGQVLQDALTNARTVHASGNEKELVQLYKGMIAHIHDRLTVRHLKAGLIIGFSFGFIMWFLAACFYFMAFCIHEGHATFDEAFGAFMGIVYAAMMSASAFALTGDMGKAKVAVHDMFQLLNRKSAIDGLCPIGEVPEDNGFEVGHFHFENVRFYYPFRKDVQVLNGISFTIAAGTSVGVVGPSGGGKSTVMAMIQRFYDPQEGEVYIGGKSNRVALRKVNIRWWRKQVGFVGQEPILFQGTVLENVKYGVDENETISDTYLEKCKQDAFLTFLDSKTAHGWQTEVGPRGSRLSGGQKQRVAICRALVRNPRVMLLDEATSALDSQSEQVVNKALEHARQGRTSFAIAHRLSSIQDSDVIIVVADGRIVEQGSHTELLNKEGVYHKLQQSSGH